MSDDLKSKTARTLKWNTVDRVSSQVLYAVVGIVLANILSQEDFGLVGALLVFQAFATLFVDSGFGSAILQKKTPTETDYSTIFWFNLAAAVGIYLILFFCAPLIADIFQGDTRLIPLSKVMFLTFILNGLGMVQTVRLMKEMNVKMIAVANMIALTLSGALGAFLAIKGYGAWALVWQSVTLAGVKSGWLWITGHWLPRLTFSMDSLRGMWRLALSVFGTSSLNTFFLYIYSFVIGAFYNLKSLGIYTQADKWSKMGSASISQILTASFVPVLSKYQDDGDHFRQCMRRINRFAAFVTLPALSGLAMVGAPLFHTLFGNKWDAAIPLFSMLAVRGIFVVMTQLFTNYMLALGYGKRLVMLEIIKDSMIIGALLATVWTGSLSLLVAGQLGASVLTWLITMIPVSRVTGYSYVGFLRDTLPFAVAATVMCAVTACMALLPMHAALQLLATIIAGAAAYVATLAISKTPELGETLRMLRNR